MEDVAKVNEAAARAGRGQAIAPTMPRSDMPSASIVGAMACPRPGMGQDVAAIAYTSHAPTESFMVARGEGRGNRPDYEMVNSCISRAL